jgi:hypothetical protein
VHENKKQNIEKEILAGDGGAQGTVQIDEDELGTYIYVYICEIYVLVKKNRAPPHHHAWDYIYILIGLCVCVCIIYVLKKKNRAPPRRHA